MATKSRLGKGLGALFPSLPGEPQHQEHAAPAAAAKEVKASKTDGHVESKSAAATAQASVNAVQGMKHAVSRETSKDDDGNDKETTTYQLDGKEIESTTFTTFYNKLINMAGQKRLTDAYTPATDPEMTAVFTDSDKNQTTVTFYTYDTNYYAAVVGNKVFLVNKMTVKEMFNAYETLINGESKTEATATPTAEAEK